MSSEQTYLDRETPTGLHPRYRFLILISLFVLISTVVVTTMLVNARKRLDSHIASIRASGAPTTAQELEEKFPPITEDRNAAIPLLKATVLLQERWITGDTPPTQQNDNNPRAFMPLAPNYKEFIKTLLSEHLECLALFQYAAQRPECQFPVDQRCDLTLPFGLLRNKVMLEADDGNVDVLYQDLMDLLKNYVHICQDPVLPYFGELLRLPCQMNAFSDLQYALSRCMLRPEQLKEVAEALKDLWSSDFCCKEAVGARYVLMEVYSRARSGESGKYRNENGEIVFTDKLYMNNGPHPGWCDNPFRINRQLEEINNRILDVQQDPNQRAQKSKVYKKRVAGTYGNLVEVSDLQAYWAVTETAIALHRYHLDKNVWPKDLNELVPQYLAAIPLDPFGPSQNAPIRYINGALGVRVYSVYHTGTDNGGWSWWDERGKAESSNKAPEYKCADIDLAFLLQLPAES